MLNGVLTGKIIAQSEPRAGSDFASIFMLRIAQQGENGLQHHLVECYMPAYMKNSLKWMSDNKIEYCIVCFDAIQYPSTWEYQGLKVLTAVKINRIERN